MVDVNTLWTSEIQSRSDYAGESILCSLSVYLEGEMCFETYYKTDKYAFSPRNVLLTFVSESHCQWFQK